VRSYLGDAALAGKDYPAAVRIYKDVVVDFPNNRRALNNLAWAAGRAGDPHLVDLMTGAIYEIPASMIRDEGNGCIRLLHLPVLDYPLLITFGDF